MLCPIDGTQLRMTERGGVEIDYCPKCRGVWLDRGELDKIVERGSVDAMAASRGAMQATRSSTPVPRRRGTELYRDAEHHDDEYERDDQRPFRKKRGGFLADLFDFD